MSKFAYRDKDRKHKVYADQVNNIVDNQKEFYCPNIECNAKLTLRANSSIKGISPYFSPLKSYPHIDNCFCRNNSFSFDDRDYDESLFNFKELVDEYYSDNFQKIPNRLESLSAIYYMVKTKKIDDTYNQTKIFEIFVDNRANRIYSNKIFGSHIIECLFTGYDNNNIKLYFKYPVDEKLPNKYSVVVEFIDRNLFREMLDKVYNNKNYSLLIIGNWKSSSDKKGNKYTRTTMTKPYQIYFPK